MDLKTTGFGKVFSDHMFICYYKNNQWQTPQIIPYQPISLHPSASVFHYGQAIFEGMKAFKDKESGVWLFRPEENIARLNKSAERMAIPQFSEKQFMDGLLALLKLDSEWIMADEKCSLYIRPVVFASEAAVSARHSNEYIFMIICSPVQAYYSHPIEVKIMEKFSRAAPGGVGYAKAAGNYAGQFHPTSLAHKEGFQQVIWTDAFSHKYLEEAGTMNIFFRIGDNLITPPVSDTILDGITRKSVIFLAEQKGINVEQRPVKIDEIITAHQKGLFKEAFGTGTAAVVSVIKSLSYQEKKYDLPIFENSFAQQLKKEITDIQYNRAEDPFGWRMRVC